MPEHTRLSRFVSSVKRRSEKRRAARDVRETQRFERQKTRLSRSETIEASRSRIRKERASNQPKGRGSFGGAFGGLQSFAQDFAKRQEPGTVTQRAAPRRKVKKRKTRVARRAAPRREAPRSSFGFNM